MYLNHAVALLFSAVLVTSIPAGAQEQTQDSWQLSDVTDFAAAHAKQGAFIIAPFVLNYVYLRFLKNPSRNRLEPTASLDAQKVAAVAAVQAANARMTKAAAEKLVNTALNAARQVKPEQISKLWWAAGSATMFAMDWFVNLCSQALSKPVANIADEANGRVNKLIAKKFDDVHTTESKGKIATANTALTALSARMDTNHDIAAQLGRAHHSRMLLYVVNNIDKAACELSQNRPIVARFLLADAAVYLRQAFAEVDANDAIVAADAKHVFKSVTLPANFGAELLAATLLLDGDGGQHGVVQYYQTLFSTWGLLDKLDVPCTVDSIVTEIEGSAAKQQAEPAEKQWLEYAKTIVQYSSGFMAFEILSLFQASSMGRYDMGGQVKSAEFITGIRTPLVAAMQENLNKVTLGHLQKLMMNGKNSHLVQKDKVISAASSLQSSYFVRTSQSYTLNAVNARSNFARAFAIVANKFHDARSAMYAGNEDLAASLIAAGMHYQRLTHNEILADDYFVTSMGRALFSMHFNTSKAFRDLIIAKILQEDESYKVDPSLKDEILLHYQTQLDAWQIGTTH